MADTVQFNLEQDSSVRLVDAYADGKVTISGERFTSSLLLLPDQLISNWAVGNVSELTMNHLEAAIAAKPEVLLLGTGRTQTFPSIALLQALANNNRSIDVMDNAAACRTYNVLVSELRNVVLALIVQAPVGNIGQA